MSNLSVISGRVVDVSTGAGIAGLRVEALDAAGIFPDLLGYARTDADGSFRMEVRATDLLALVGQRAVTAYLRVVHVPSPGVYHVLADTRKAGPKWPLDGRKSTATLHASTTRILSRLPALLPFVVSGTVHDENGPMAGVTVELYDRHPVNGLPAEPLATGTTDARGHYRITYGAPANKDLADLVVRVEAGVTTDSGTRCHAPPSLRVKVVQEGHRWRGVSAYRSARDRLVASGVDFEAPGSVTAEQREHLACSQRLPLADVEAVLGAQSIANASYPLEPEVAFAALTRGMGTDRDSFFQHPKSAVRQALAEAVVANQVPQRYGRQTELDAALEKWVQAAAAWSLEARSNPCGLGELLSVAGVSEAGTRTSFAEQFCRNEASLPDFWSHLTGSFDKSRIQLAFQWWSLARGHLPLIEKLEARRADDIDEKLSDLAKLSEQEWGDVLDDIMPGSQAPASIPGTDEAERKANYARVLYLTMATAFPTKVFGHRVRAMGSTEPPAIQAFFHNHTSFELGKHRLSQEPYRTTVEAMSTSEDRKRIRAMERLFRFAPTYERTSALLAKGYDSAHAVHSAGKCKFVADMQQALGAQTAIEIYTKACWQAGASSAIFAQHALASNKLAGKVFASSTPLAPAAPGNQIPDWETLFGSAGGCSCKHCAGVLGPAAYLTDALVWLDGFDSEVEKSATTRWTALDILVGSKESGSNQPPGRRPDLPLLELTCKSAHTPQPYIDLVNEILEVAVAKDAGVSFDLGSSIKSTFEPDELAAGPEILYEVPHIGAWRSLMERRHPFTLPVCLFDRESEAYLRYLGVTRAEIVETLGKGPDLLKQIAKARLGVRDDAHAGLDATLLSGWKMLLGTDPGTAQEHWGGKTAASLKAVPTFLKYAGLTFSELEELLATRYVNGVGGTGAPGLAEIVLDPADGCDTAEMTLHLDEEGNPPLSEPHLLRLHRFLRLRLHTGLSSTDLDLLIAAFWTEPSEPMEIDATMLHKITSALALAKELKLAVRELAALFADLDLHERWETKSAYRQYFLNRLVESPEPAVFKNVLSSPGSTADLSLHKTALQQALGITEKELRLLVNADALAAELLLPDSQLVLDDFEVEAAILPRVSELWRHVRIARALGLRIADYLVLRAYSGLMPIGVGASPADAEAFVHLVRDWKAQKLTVAELQWALRAFAPSGTALAPDGAAVEALRAELTGAVAALVSETGTAEDPVGTDDAAGDAQTRAFALLDQLLTAGQRDGVMAVLRGMETPPTDGSWRAAIEPLGAYLPGAIEHAQDLLAGPFGHPVHGRPYLKSADERFAYVAKWLDRHIRASRLVTEKLAAATELPTATVTYLITRVLGSQGAAGSGYHLLDDFLPANKPGATEEDQTAGLALVLRHARLIERLRVGEPIPPGPEAMPGAADNPGELLWLYPETPPASPVLHSLPATQPDVDDFGPADRARFARILTVVRRIGLRDRMQGGADALRELLQAPPAPSEPLAAAQSLLAEKSGWDLGAIIALCDHLEIDSLEELLSDENLLRLEKGIALVQRLGIDPHDVLAFLNLEAKPPAAAEQGLQPTTDPEAPKNARDLVLLARRAAKAKLSADEWQKVAKKIRDPFRELLRDRLVDALVPKKHDTRNDLYGFHLIDVDMNACMMTSRIVQATNAVQVFVQRSFLGLDGDVMLPDQAGKQWEWRSAYRVWEANRKVFLWPENWLEPELRDDMTPLFRELLTNLSSGEITDASAERALEKYLSGLHEIARLEPMALWYEHETKTDHVVARTRSQPRKWFYRRREHNRYWTAWEKMDLDIEAESALLVGANRRLYLFWPQLVQKSDPRIEPATPKPGHPGHPPAQELGESDEDYAERFTDYHERILAWAKELMGLQPDQPIESEPETTYHYEVRVAWSSYMEGAWTPKKLSDCTPLPVSPAKGDGETGYEPHNIVFVAEPTAALVPQGAVHIACVVTASPLSPKNILAGRFYFDACGGGRWTSKSIEGQVYHPTKPYGSKFSRAGFQEVDSGGALLVDHIPFGKTSPQMVPLLGGRKGKFFIVSPSRYGKDPTHAFDRFLFADHKAVFHARAVHTTPALSIVLPGQAASVSPSGDNLAALISGALAEWAQNQSIDVPVHSIDQYQLESFEHPYACEFANRLAAGGAAKLLGWKEDPKDSPQYLQQALSDIYDPTAHVLAPFPKQEVSFDFGSTYGMYNWELFFHVPFTIAQRLSQEGRYAEAQRWFHYIFNPVNGVNAAGPKRFWCVKPFFEIDDVATIQSDLEDLAEESSYAASLQALVAEDEATQKAADEMKAQLAAMSEHPFSPHVLARMRPLAYMKNVFMRYLQNLLDWADSLFRRDTMESIHEALTLYLLAADLLGPRPEVLDHKADPPGKTFEQLLEAGIDEFGNAAVDVETIVPKHVPVGFQCTDDGPPVPDFRLYFCIPPNEQLYGYWDTVADRLFKIRNCMNIDGVVRALPLFAPPIDPALLVRAAAAGVRLDQVLDALAAPAPLYRFLRLHAKAVEFAGAVLSLGQGLLAALEKRDGEELALLRQRHELAVLDAEREVRKQAIQEAKETLAGLNRSRESAETRLQYYTSLLDQGLLSQEKTAERNTRIAKELRRMSATVNEMGAFLSAIPDISVGMAAASTIGGRALQLATSAAAQKLSSEADYLNTDASLAQTSAGYARRAQEWKLQKSVGEKEIAQLDRQIVAQEIRIAIAERELDNLDLRREQAREIDAFFRTKFTSRDLYSWMAAQLAAEHYRAYQTAYDMAKRAERAYQLERGDDTTFVRFGAWDSLKKGLLAGERLLADLRALDAAYLSRSDREREITKHVSLSEIAGEQLTQLRDTGTAQLDLHTYHFDADYPGHYFRRLKTVAISVATVRPAADGVQCELTLLKSSYRKTSQIGAAPYPGDPYGDTLHRFNTAAQKALVTSTAENDPGLFEVSLRDEMLLPFEGSGVVSQWRIEVDPRTNRFPMHRISDVVLHLRYTAKDGGPSLRQEALTYAGRAETPEPGLQEPPNGLKQRTRVFSARRDFDEAWAVFTAGTLTAPSTWSNRLELRFTQRHFRSFFGNPKVKIVRVQVSATFNEKYNPPPPPDPEANPPVVLQTFAYDLTPPGGPADGGVIPFRTGEPSDIHESLAVPVVRDDDNPAPWTFVVPTGSSPSAVRDGDNHNLLKPDAFEDIWFTVTYEAQ